jgi:riboflavin biosynthesis pyrimidine reductase
MRELLPEPTSAVDLHAHYARDWLEPGGIRVNMIASADGAAAAGGLSRGLQTPGDNRVFEVLRDLADVVLVGSATARVEGYRPLRLDDVRIAVRRERGLTAGLPIAVVSRSLHLDLDSPLFRDNRPLVLTCSSSDPAARTRLAERAEVLVCGDSDIDYGAARRVLAERGLTRLLCEGGPTILGRLSGADQLDELCVSVTPLLVGPGAGRIVAGDAWSGHVRRLRLTGLLEEDGALFLRYRRG